MIKGMLISEGSGTIAGEEEMDMPDTFAMVDYEASDNDPQFSEVRKYWLPDPVLSRDITGVVIAAITTEDPDQPRWTTMDLYRTSDGRYVYYRVGHSLVYHDLGGYSGACRSGVTTAPDDLPDEAEPCAKCRPPLEPDGPVRMEESLPAIFVCDDVPGVLQALVKTRNGGTTISRPAQRLLADARRRDEAFRSYQGVERL